MNNTLSGYDVNFSTCSFMNLHSPSIQSLESITRNGATVMMMTFILQRKNAPILSDSD